MLDSQQIYSGKCAYGLAEIENNSSYKSKGEKKRRWICLTTRWYRFLYRHIKERFLWGAVFSRWRVLFKSLDKREGPRRKSKYYWDTHLQKLIHHVGDYIWIRKKNSLYITLWPVSFSLYIRFFFFLIYYSIFFLR